MPVSKNLVKLLVIFGALVPAMWGQADVQGQWSTASYQMPINPIHVALMHNGKILVVAGSGNCPPSQSGCPSGAPYGPSNSSGALVLDPAAQNITQLTVSWDMFCNAMTVLADGRVMVNGGTIAYDPFQGIQKTAIFDPSSNSFTDVQSMAHGRWYPSVVMLGDGRIMAFSGTNENGVTNTAVEIYTVGSGWSQQYTANFTPPLYPRLHLLPNGNVFYSGSGQATQMFNTSSHTWSSVDVTNFGASRVYGSSVLLPLTPANNYDPKVIIMGGGTPATGTTETIDLGASNPQWQWGPDMTAARIEMDAVILPTGKVLAMGGSMSDEDSTTAVLAADLYNPSSNSFSSAGSNSFARLYHTVALLLPDATIWLAGSNPARGTYEHHAEIYKPAYLFTRDGNNNVVAATRPTIAGAPGNISWGGSFAVSTPDAANISQVALVRPGASTHAFDMDQRLVGMNFAAGSGTLTVTGPPNGNIAPPGYYMLFLINNKGVPSVAKFVLLNGTASNPAPNVTAISPTSGTAGGGTGVTITGTGFLPGANVTFGGSAATAVTVASSTSISATTPAHAAGTVNVVVGNPDGQSDTLSGGYTYIAANPAPTVTSITPNTGTVNGGTGVTIAGTGFLSGATVSFGGTAATGATITSSTSITATAPAHAAGATSVVVANTDGKSGTLSGGYNYTAAIPAPNATSITPNTGPTSGGAAVTINGTGFQPGATVFIGGTAAAGVTVVSGTSITATTPAHATGAVNVVVANPDGQSDTLANAYTYVTLSPAVNAIAPSAGPASGGTVVTIVGANFLPGAAVSFGGTPATGVTVTSNTSISATTPAHVAGTVNVVVANTSGQSGTLANGFTYNPGGVSNPSLDLGVAPGWPGALSVTAGQNGSYTLSITGDGINGTAKLSCSGAPAGATCSTPASISVSSAAATFNITVTTTARTVGALHPPASMPMPWGWAVTALGMVLWPGASASKWSGRRYRRYLGLLPLALLLFTISCGGGGMGGSNPSGPQPTPNGTPAGTYTLTVTATSGSTTGTTPLTLTVK